MARHFDAQDHQAIDDTTDSVDAARGQEGPVRNPLFLVVIGLLVIIAVLLALLIARGCGSTSPAGGTEYEDYTGDRATYTGKKNIDTIDIPGYGSLSLKAGETAQVVNLHNPQENTCYFKMSLLLADGEELWSSDLVPPGKAVYQIELARPLEAGTYAHTILRYECFAMDEARSPLNGSEIELDLNVLE